MSDIRHDWTQAEVLNLFEMPLSDLRGMAKSLHEKYAKPDIQKCVLLSIKTGGCPEDCGYCSQSAHYKTNTESQALMPKEDILQQARLAKKVGASRFCMGTAWRQVPAEKDEKFQRVLEVINGVSEMGMEVCCTLGMATESQLKKLKEAGLTAYNHNLDTSREFYPSVTTTRTYDDRLNTLKAAREAGVQLCSGGILGLGEGITDRASMLRELAGFNPHPESVPVNLLVPIAGTPMENNEPVPFEDFLRTIAVARILMPKSRVRLSAGRNSLSEEQQKQCFEAGANSIFYGERLLTTENVAPALDDQLLPQEL